MAPATLSVRPLSPCLSAYLASEVANFSDKPDVTSGGMAAWVGTPVATLGTARLTWNQTPPDRLVPRCDLLPDLSRAFGVTPENQGTLDAVAIELDSLIADLGARTPLRQLLVASS